MEQTQIFNRFQKKAMSLHNILPEGLKRNVDAVVKEIMDPYTKWVVISNDERLEVRVKIYQPKDPQFEQDGGKVVIRVTSAMDLDSELLKLLQLIQFKIEAIESADSIGAFEFTQDQIIDQDSKEEYLCFMICKLCNASRVQLARDLVDGKEIKFGNSTFKRKDFISL